MKKDQIIRRFHDIDEEELEPSEFAELFQDSIRQQQFSEGEIVKGVVARVTPDYVFVDVGFKSEGAVPVAEFTDENGQLTVGEGDEVSVLYQRGESAHGTIRLSRRRAEAHVAWERSWRPAVRGVPSRARSLARSRVA